MDLQGRNLSIEMQGADVRVLHAELVQLGFAIPEEELSNSLFGEATREAVAQLQKNNRLKSTGEVDERTAARLTVLVRRFESFSGDFRPLIRTLQNERVSSLRELALTTNREALTRKIIDNKANPEGENPEDFAGRLYTNLFQAEPTAVLRNMLDDPKATPLEDETMRTNVASFLSRLPETFNIRTSSVYDVFKNESAFEGIAPELRENIKTELKSLQRVAAISPVPEVVPVLMKANVTSAMLISEMPESQFVQRFAPQLGSDGETALRQVHANAVKARIRNEQALIALKEVEQGTGIAAIDLWMRQGLNTGDEVRSVLEKNNLSWDALFGDSDLCECGECTSVYSAANYFVELLQYLRNNNLDPDSTGPQAIKSDPKDISGTPLQKLFDRRPDLKCLQLTCANTNTILPYVDLVNEVMESYVAFQKTLPFNVSEDETSGELLAQPQHVEYRAYERLQAAVYPFSLPYHQPIDSAGVYLNSLRTSRHELLDTFRSARNDKLVTEPLTGTKNSIPMPALPPELTPKLKALHDDYLDRAADAEYLGLTQEEYVILTKEAFVSKEYWDIQSAKPPAPQLYLDQIASRPVHAYYGYGSEQDMLSLDESRQLGLTFVKNQFLKRTGLQYLELVELLKTQTLNPNMPTERALNILERIQLSYRFLQTRVNNRPGVSADEKYRFVVEAIVNITNPDTVSALNRALGIEDPCDVSPKAAASQPADIKSWVHEWFERVGQIIVLDNGVKCIDGRFFLRRDKLLDMGVKVENCQIINEATGAVLGSVDKTTGLVTMPDAQAGGDFSAIVFVGNKGEQGSFLSVQGRIFLLIAQSETCDLELVRLIHLDGSPLTTIEYDRIHRFIRLWRKAGWTINETDSAFVALGAAKNFDLSPRFLHQLAAVRKVHETTGLELTKLLTFWTDISTVGPTSLYKRLFLTRNDADVFHADADGRFLADPTLKIQDHAPALMAALNLRADDIAAITQHEAITTLTIPNVSKLYRYRLLSKLLNLGIAEFISVLALFDDPFASPDATLLFLKQWERIEDAGFDYRQLNYILQGQDDPTKPFALTQKATLELAKTLYDGLNAIEEAHQDVKADTVAGIERVKQEAALLYDQATVNNIVGLLEGTNVYSAKCPDNIKDRLRPIAVSPQVTTPDYEFLQFSNYPLLTKKIKYDRTSGSLQIKGILTEFEKNGSSLFWVDDFINTAGFISKLIDPNLDPVSQDVSQFLWTTFSPASQNTLADGTASDLEKREVLESELNSIIAGSSIAPNFSAVTLSPVTQELMAKGPTGDELIRLNRMLLEDAYPREIAKNKRVGLNTLRQNLSPDLSLESSVADIENQQTKLFDDIFSTEFAAFKADCLAGDDNNTAQHKREKFLEIFLPHLRKELTRRLILETVSAQTGLTNDVVELLITKILVTKTAPLEPVFNLFAKITKMANTGAVDWNGYLIPATEGDYTFVVKESATEPVLNLDGRSVSFNSQPGSVGEWWSDPQKLQAGKVYELILTGTNLSNLYWRTPASAISTIPSTSLLPRYAEDHAKTAFTHVQKAALLISGFKLSLDEIQYLFEHGPDFGDFNFNQLTLTHFLRLEAYTRLRNSLPPGKINIFQFFKWTLNGQATDLNEKIAELTGWKKERVDQLTKSSHFNLLEPASFRNEINLLKLQQALAIADRIGVNIDLLFEWANPASDFVACRKISEGIHQALRAKYNQEDWQQALKPLNDKLRINQRNALIAYLLVQPDVIRWGATDADGLFEFFLIDVQMEPCMETSRMVQAISSVQLFIQRCFLGLEANHSNIPADLLDRGRWEWMQRYRIWEANRKVFLYPENWIEGDLRDDKSAFFKELESDLLQKDISKQNVTDALKAYLYKVDEVANMEVIGVYVEKRPHTQFGQTFERSEKLHVFARTRNAPYAFYYRYLDILASNWYPWEKIQVDIPSYDVEDLQELGSKRLASKTLDNTVIESVTYDLNPNYKKVIGNGCFLTPFVWNGRLLIFFPQFVRKTRTNEDVAGSKSVADMAEDSTDSAKPIEFWEIKMAWSEYRNGRWTPKQLSKDAISDIPNIAVITKFWRDLNATAKAKKKIDEAWRDKQLKFNAAWKKRRRWEASAPADKDRDWERYVKAWDQEVDSKDYFDLQMDSNDPESLFSVYKKAYDEFKNDPQPAPAADISRYVFSPLPSDNGKLLGIKVDYAENVNGNQHLPKGIFEFNGSQLTAIPTQSYTPHRTAFTRVDTFNHFASSKIESWQDNEFSSHQFDDSSATTYTLEPLNDAVTISFHHSDSHKLLGTINVEPLESFFKFPLEGVGRNINKDDVFGGYDHDSDTKTANIYHELKRPYSIYNWELFFHTPMMLADALSKSQQFEEAMKWYHFVFNPMAAGSTANAWWQFSPFKDTEAKRILAHILNQLKPNKPDDEINEWRSNPFNPHVVARSRPVAYMKWVVMKYVDNLVAWGDHLFRQDTMESINQATQLYVLAGHILGPRPQLIPKRGKIKPQTYLSLLDKWDAFSNAMVELELALPFSNQTPELVGRGNGVVGLANIFGFASTTYFCIPNNPKLMGYWDTIADRLFKIRHCENIEGVFRRLPLFEPAIDPALLVKAAAQGLSIASVLNDLNTPMPNYRFYYLLQKALELCAELKGMGSAILSAIEKKDNETLALIRARHESGMLNLMLEIKKQQLEEAQKALEGLQQSRKSPEHRMKYFLQLIGEDLGEVPGSDSDFSEFANAIETPVSESGLKLMKFEKEDMDKANLSADLQLGAGIVETLAGILYAIPMLKGDVAPMGIGTGVAFGGTNLGQLTQAISRVVQLSAGHLAHQSTSAAKKGSFLRALQERVMQANAAGHEIKQIDKQILAQQIRINIANLEISNQQKQIENSQEIEEFLKSKYSNEELYSWMKGNLSTLYRQVYNLAFDLAKKAEKVFRFERGLTSSSFIQAGYWDAGHNGLLAGEQLYVGLKQLEAAYHETAGYDYEITKHVSLRQLNPIAILQLKEIGRCEFSLPEVLFDIDYPGHYKRRLKNVSLTIPCVAGPYVGLNATLRLLENKFRNSPIARDYPEKTDETDERFQSYIVPINAIAACSGQNDSGMFELNFKDERYLPFEGAGAISSWRLEMPTALRQFDYNTISDVVIHLRYTSNDGGASLKMEAEKSVAAYIRNAEQVSEEDGLFAIFDLRHDFPTQWHLLFHQNQPTVSWEINHSHFPYLFNGRELEITGAKIYLKPEADKVLSPPPGSISLNGQPINFWTVSPEMALTEGDANLTGSPFRTWTIDKGTNFPAGNEIRDLLILIRYRAK